MSSDFEVPLSESAARRIIEQQEMQIRSLGRQLAGVSLIAFVAICLLLAVLAWRN